MRRHSSGLARSAVALLVAAVAVAVAIFAAGEAAARARLESARWSADDPRNGGSAIADDGTTITTELAGRKKGEDAFVAGRLEMDVSGGRDIDLSFLTDVPWVTCEAPGGLSADERSGIDFVCRARARGLDALAERTRVYVKVDPTGGLAHRKLYWVLVPPASP